MPVLVDTSIPELAVYLTPHDAAMIDLHVYVGGAAALDHPGTLYSYAYPTPDFAMPSTKAGDGQYADVTELFCTADRCPVIVGNTLVYLDKGHLTVEVPPAVGTGNRSAGGPRARPRLTCCGLLATPTTRRVRHGGASNRRADQLPAVNRMALIAAAHPAKRRLRLRSN